MASAAAILPALKAVSTAIGIISSVKGLTSKPRQPALPAPAAAPVAVMGGRDPVQQAGIGPTQAAGVAPVSFGSSTLTPMQKATNIFTAGAYGPGGISGEGMGDVRDPTSARAAAAARNQLIQTLTQGGTPIPGSQFPDIGFEYLKRVGITPQERSTAGGLHGLLEFVNR